MAAMSPIAALRGGLEGLATRGARNLPAGQTGEADWAFSSNCSPVFQFKLNISDAPGFHQSWFVNNIKAGR